MTRKIGAHLSAAGGVELAVERAAAIGSNCVQVFSGSPRVWKKKPLAAHHTKKIAANQAKLDVTPIFTHAIYLTNLASDKADLIKKSFDSLKYDLEFDAMVKGAGVVVHLGSHTGRGWRAVRQGVAEQIAKLLEVTPKNSNFLIENSAGQKGKLCSELGQIRWLLDRVGQLNKSADKRLGVCLDTCHLYAAGYSLGKKKRIAPPAAKNPSRGLVLEEIERFKLWNRLRLLHINDSKDPFASGRDRHANLGRGEMIMADVRLFINQLKMKKLPLVTEVPGLDKKGPDAANMKLLKEMAT